MPTINIRSGFLGISDKKKIALKVARELKGHGLDPSHCMVIFSALDEGSLFSAGLPMPINNGESTRSQVFFIRASIAASRDQFFRKDFATQLFDFFSTQFAGSFFYLQYEDVFTENVFYATGETLTNAGTKG
ncbi:hypothetical protein [Pseudomonas sp. S36]|uniref:hypothetical protein n=1 Tax=Pseudomonas sp. S36 TaxID=2767447 RepID=UPI0019143323|nr:hypothetical protein [Pseudomonas sp. S36]MBK4988202.1 hypothetical protein [Pseudomonas sp. S36]